METKKKVVKKEKENEIIKLDGKKYLKKKFMIEETHPAIGRILILGDDKFKVMNEVVGDHRQGTFIAPLTERDEDVMQEYDEDLDRLSEKLSKRLDIKRLIKDNMKTKKHSDIKTGLFILKEMEKGSDVTEEHLQGCYQYGLHYKNHSFDFISIAVPEEVV